MLDLVESLVMSWFNSTMLLCLLVCPLLVLRSVDLGPWLHTRSRKKPKRRRRRKRRSRPSVSSTPTPTFAKVSYDVTVSSPTEPVPAPLDVKERRHHGDGRTFTNPWASWKYSSDFDTFLILFWRQLTGQGKYPSLESPGIKVVKPRFEPTRNTQALRATWLGHATCYVEYPSGLRVLFDPIFRERCSLWFDWLGPKRFTAAPCQAEDIPFVDAVVISHNHCDHMDGAAIADILARHPAVHFFVPLRVKAWFIAARINPAQVTELDWWDARDVTLTLTSPLSPRLTPRADGTALPPSTPTTSAVESTTTTTPTQPATLNTTDYPRTITARFSCLPCQHTSAQGLFDKAYTLWASWSVESGGKSVFFGGDTGYRTVPALAPHEDDYGPDHADLPACPAFAEIGDLLGPFDLGLLPIGAYDPRHMMSPTHANPFDSVNIFVDTRCRRALGIHWGTWVLTEEDVREPPKILRQALERRGWPMKGVFDVCDIGGSIEC